VREIQEEETRTISPGSRRGVCDEFGENCAIMGGRNFRKKKTKKRRRRKRR
jgi:hypothetical protein